VAVDVVVDTANASIAATDLIMESSMTFIDFVPISTGNA
jgi:hypothetical protein